MWFFGPVGSQVSLTVLLLSRFNLLSEVGLPPGSPASNLQEKGGNCMELRRISKQQLFLQDGLVLLYRLSRVDRLDVGPRLQVQWTVLSSFDLVQKLEQLGHSLVYPDVLGFQQGKGIGVRLSWLYQPLARFLAQLGQSCAVVFTDCHQQLIAHQELRGFDCPLYYFAQLQVMGFNLRNRSMQGAELDQLAQFVEESEVKNTVTASGKAGLSGAVLGEVVEHVVDLAQQCFRGVLETSPGELKVVGEVPEEKLAEVKLFSVRVVHLQIISAAEFNMKKGLLSKLKATLAIEQLNGFKLLGNNLLALVRPGGVTLLTTATLQVLQEIEFAGSPLLCEGNLRGNIFVLCGGRDLAFFQIDLVKNQYFCQVKHRLASPPKVITFVSPLCCLCLLESGKFVTCLLSGCEAVVRQAKISMPLHPVVGLVGNREFEMTGLLVSFDGKSVHLRQLSLAKSQTVEEEESKYEVIIRKNEKTSELVQACYLREGTLILELKNQLYFLQKRQGSFYFIDSVLFKGKDKTTVRLRSCGPRLALLLQKERVGVLRVEVGPSPNVQNVDMLLYKGNFLGLAEVQERESALLLITRQAAGIQVTRFEQAPAQTKIKEFMPFLEVSQAEQLALRLGLTLEQFYLIAWRATERENDAFETLVMVKDYKTVNREIKHHLKYRRVPLLSVQWVYEKLKKFAAQKLQECPCQEHLKSYVKADFLTKKLSCEVDIHQTLNYEEFAAIKDCHIFKRIIAEAGKKEYKQISEILNIFKLPLLYDLRRQVEGYFIQLREGFFGLLAQIPAFLPFFQDIQHFKLESVNHSRSSVLESEVVLRKDHKRLWQKVTLSEYLQEVTQEHLFELAYNNGNLGLLKQEIQSTVARFLGSSWCQSRRHTKHSIVCLNFEEMVARQDDLRWRLFYYILEQANLLGIDSSKFIGLFRTYYKVDLQGINRLVLLSSIHQRLQPQLTMDQLLLMKDEDLIEHLFLSGRRLFVLTELLPLYQTVRNQRLFEESLAAFVKSSKCSLVELHFLLDSVLDPGFQQANPTTTSCLASAILGKIRAGEREAIVDLFDKLKHLKVHQKLVKQLEVLSKYLQNYDTVIVCSASKLLLAELLDPTLYFLNHIYSVVSSGKNNYEDELVKLKDARATFYPAYPSSDIDELFAKALIEYDYFEPVSTLFLGRLSTAQFQRVALKVLSKIYWDAKIADFGMVARYVQKVLDLLTEKTLFRRRERARLKLGLQLMGAGHVFPPQFIAKVGRRMDFMKRVLEMSIQRPELRFSYVYKYLLKLSSNNLDKIEIYTPEYLLFLVHMSYEFVRHGIPLWHNVWEVFQGKIWREEVAVFKLLFEHWKEGQEAQCRVIDHILVELYSPALLEPAPADIGRLKLSDIIDLREFIWGAEKDIFDLVGLIQIQYQQRVYLNFFVKGMLYRPAETVFLMARLPVPYQKVIEAFRKFEVGCVVIEKLLAYKLKFLYVKGFMLLDLPIFYEAKYFQESSRMLTSPFFSKEVRNLANELHETHRELSNELKATLTELTRIINQQEESSSKHHIQLKPLEEITLKRKVFSMSFIPQQEVYTSLQEYRDRHCKERQADFAQALSPADQDKNLYLQRPLQFLLKAQRKTQYNIYLVKALLNMAKVQPEFDLRTLFDFKAFLWPQIEGGAASNYDHLYELLLPRLQTAVNQQNYNMLAKLLYFGFGLDKKYQYHIFQLHLGSRIEALLKSQEQAQAVFNLLEQMCLRTPIQLLRKQISDFSKDPRSSQFSAQFQRMAQIMRESEEKLK